MFKLLKNLKWIDYLFLVIVVGLIGLQVFLDLRLPEYMANISSELTQGARNVNYILKNGGFMLLCALGSLGSAIVVGFFSANIASRLSFNIRGRIYDKIQSFSLSEIKKFSTASLITRTTNDVTQVQLVVSMGMQALIKAPILAVCAIVKILGKGWQWSIATAVAIAILTVVVAVVVVFLSLVPLDVRLVC